jgi:hypothetical protein
LATLARYKQASYLAQRSLSALLRSAKSRARGMQGTSSGWYFLGYPALLCSYAYGVSSAEKGSWEAVVTAVRDAGSGDASDELRLPPQSQMYFAQPLSGMTLGQSPVLSFANRIADWLFPLTQGWIPRRVDFERAFDRFDVVLCSLSLRKGCEEWRPRCSVARTPLEGDSARGTFDDIAQYWFLNRVQRAEPGSTSEPLVEIFADNEDEHVFERISNWNPAPPPTS